MNMAKNKFKVSGNDKYDKKGCLNFVQSSLKSHC